MKKKNEKSLCDLYFEVDKKQRKLIRFLPLYKLILKFRKDK